MYFELVLDNLKQTRDISIANEIHVYSMLMTRGDSRSIVNFECIQLQIIVDIPNTYIK